MTTIESQDVHQSAPRGILADVFVFGGLALLTYGVHMVSPAAAWSVLGTALVLIGARR